MICLNCNFQNEEAAKFCRNCGAQLFSNQQQQILPKKTSKRKLVLWILAGLLLIFIGGAVVVLFEKKQLPDTISTPIFDIKFEYDSQNHITKISKYDKDGNLEETVTHTYLGDDLVKVIRKTSLFTLTQSFEKSENKIIVNRTFYTQNDKSSSSISVIYLDDDGYPIKHETENEVISYYYFDGNLIKLSTHNFIRGYQYDENKSPFYYCNAPKWYHCVGVSDMIDNLDLFGNKNNSVVETTSFPNTDKELKTEYKYEKNLFGFPTKIIFNAENGNESVYSLTYK